MARGSILFPPIFPLKIYCSGIGGIGLSAYASLQRGAGHEVIGSDHTGSPILERLRGEGIVIFREQNGSHVPPDANLFVYSEAIPPDAPERIHAATLGIPQQSYPNALSELTRGHRTIAVCGTHGKSSTTAMAARMLMQADCDPTVVVGTLTPDLGGRNVRAGRGTFFLLEACEYRKVFLVFSPEIIILTTCDGDHFDAYGSLTEYHDAFVAFLQKLPDHGKVITHLADPHCRTVVERSRVAVVDADRFPFMTLRVPGRHMQENAQCVLALASVLGLPMEQAAESLKTYAGSWRRMEVRGEILDGVTVIDDYGHHPVEIRATLQALRGAYPNRRIVCVYQPHTHDRTLALYEEFTAAFTHADLVIIPNIYDARSHCDRALVDEDRFVSDIARGSGVAAVHGQSLHATEHLLQENILRSGDVLLCMGAGDITDLATRMLLIASHPNTLPSRGPGFSQSLRGSRRPRG